MQKFKVDNNIIYCVTTGYGTLTTSMNKDIYYSRLNEFIKYYSFLRNNLSNNDFKLLRLHGLGILFSGYKNKLMFRELLGVYKLLRKSRIKMIDRRIFNPYILYKTLKSYISIKRFYK